MKKELFPATYQALEATGNILKDTEVTGQLLIGIMACENSIYIMALAEDFDNFPAEHVEEFSNELLDLILECTYRNTLSILSFLYSKLPHFPLSHFDKVYQVWSTKPRDSAYAPYQFMGEVIQKMGKPVVERLLKLVYKGTEEHADSIVFLLTQMFDNVEVDEFIHLLNVGAPSDTRTDLSSYYVAERLAKKGDASTLDALISFIENASAISNEHLRNITSVIIRLKRFKNPSFDSRLEAIISDFDHGVFEVCLRGFYGLEPAAS